MRRAPMAVGMALLASIALATATRAQDAPIPGMPGPRIVAISPSGGRPGTTALVTVAGTDLGWPLELVTSLPGARAAEVERLGPPNLRAGGETVRGAAGNAIPLVRRTFRLDIPPDAPIGLHDLRVADDDGVSNPRAFAVGDLDEVAEREPNNDRPEAHRVAIGSAIGGVISAPTDVDDFLFAGKMGQRVILSLLTTSVDSRLVGAIEVFDASGRKLAASREYRGGDALADCTLPADGEYLARVHEFTYTSGGPDHFYRLAISTAPWIDAVFPPAVEPGRSNHLVVFGRNLPGGRPDPSALLDGRILDRAEVTFDAPADMAGLAFRGFVPPESSGMDGVEFRLRNEAGSSNPALLTFRRAPLTLDLGDNDSPAGRKRSNRPARWPGGSRRGGIATGTPSSPARAKSWVSRRSATGSARPWTCTWPCGTRPGRPSASPTTARPSRRARSSSTGRTTPLGPGSSPRPTAVTC